MELITEMNVILVKLYGNLKLFFNEVAPAQYPTVREGDYLNIGAGAEMGIYSRPDWLTQNSDGLDHYFTDYRLSVPMTLSFYNYSGGIENIFHWYPQNDQWWITGFNPKHVGKIDVHKQVMVGSVVFNTKALYDDFVKSNSKRKEVKDYIICDEDNMTVWIMWYDKETV